ncbi:MAG: PKD domain-containing protein [Candidatus Anammoxibacter sp.]
MKILVKHALLLMLFIVQVSAVYIIYTIGDIDTILAQTKTIESITIRPNTVGNDDLSNTDNAIRITIIASMGQAPTSIFVRAVDTDDTSVLKGDAKAGDALSTAFAEISSGKYEGVYKPFTSLEDGDSVKIQVIFGADAQILSNLTESDWDVTKSNVAESGFIMVDSIVPKVRMVAEIVSFHPTLVEVTFSEGMNTNTLNDNLPIVTNETSGGLLTVSSLQSGSADKATATFELQEDIDPANADTYNINFSSSVTDDAGNALAGTLDLDGVDQAEFTTTSRYIGLEPTTTTTFIVTTTTTTVTTTTTIAGTVPIANFIADKPLGIVPLTVRFTDISTGNPTPTEWLWDFGDGGASIEPNPSHVYSIPDLYSVTLTVKNSLGEDSLTKTDFINAQSFFDKSFTFNCDQSMKTGFFGLHRITMNVGDVENCTLKLTNHKQGQTKEVDMQMLNWFWSGIKIEPARSVTDENGELKITISAIKKGTDWAAWAVPNDRGVFKFNKKTYDTGLAWGMFVRVK